VESVVVHLCIHWAEDGGIPKGIFGTNTFTNRSTNFHQTCLSSFSRREQNPPIQVPSMHTAYPLLPPIPLQIKDPPPAPPAPATDTRPLFRCPPLDRHAPPSHLLGPARDAGPQRRRCGRRSVTRRTSRLSPRRRGRRPLPRLRGRRSPSCK